MRGSEATCGCGGEIGDEKQTQRKPPTWRPILRHTDEEKITQHPRESLNIEATAKSTRADWGPCCHELWSGVLYSVVRSIWGGQGGHLGHFDFGEDHWPIHSGRELQGTYAGVTTLIVWCGKNITGSWGKWTTIPDQVEGNCLNGNCGLPFWV